MTRLFGFAQFDFAGRLAVADGRYVVRKDDRERVLVMETLGAPPPTGRRRRKPRAAHIDDLPAELPLARVTAVRAFEPLADEGAAKSWLETVADSEETVDRLLEEGTDDLNRALHAQAVASGNPYLQAVALETAVAVRIGFGSGEQLADGLFTEARQVDPGLRPDSRRRLRDEELRPQQRIAAVLGDREHLDACETLLLRARADLDAGRNREAALQMRVGLEALLIELQGSFSDPGHEEDMATLKSRRHETGDLANAALRGALDTTQLESLQEIQALCERVLRRRRILSS
ncbi:MAG TPA: hypothetical protein VFT10_09830 [Solirubrobacterales bacterium]|nr:hypothetical protein [Solirubrobacterales bacterium]